MTRKDLGAVLRLEAASHEDPWSREVFQAYLASPRVLAELVERDGRLAAFHLVELEERRLHVLNLTVGEEHRRQGVGRAILARVDEIARERELPVIELEVRESNLGAQLLYRACGYEAVEILRAHYHVEDGYLMRRRVGPGG
jgi:ribosomal-protein-alanine N-acetyltransferase